MSNSSLISGTMLTNNCSKPRNHVIDRITPHYMAWYTDAKTCCESFMPSSRQASANYCIGKDGEIWLNVEEKNRAWTSGSSYNDNRAITIECANYMDSARYGMLPDATWNSLVKLCADICKRNGIPHLNFTGNDFGNLTMHKYYQDTDCPGPWFSNQFDRLASEVNALIDGKPSPSPEPEPSPTPSGIGGLYRCTVNGLRIRNWPSVTSAVIGHYNSGDEIVLDDWYTIEDGYVWGRYTGLQSGLKRYIAIGKYTGKPEPDDYLIKI